MKKLFIKTTIIALLLGGGACKKLIEIPGNPPTEISGKQQFADSATVMTAMAGVYSYTSSGVGFTYNDAYLTLATGLSSDELSSTNVSDAAFQEFYGYGLTANNTNVATLWSAPYTGVYPVNAILEGIAGNPAISETLRTELTGELKVVRALYYFNLVNLFNAVPLVTSSDYAANTRIPRTSADSIYAQVLKDLTEAEQALTADYPSPGRARPNLYAAKFLEAKMHLYRQEWQAAYDAAGVVIGSGVYSLETDLNNVFLDGSNEAVWQLPATGLYGSVSEAIRFVPYSGSVPTYLVTPSLLGAFETGDQRLQNWIGTSVSGGQTYYFPYKYKHPSPDGNNEDYMVFRLGELYLIRAEAAAQLGNTAGALSDLDQVRNRAGLSGSTAAAQGDILAAIRHERQVELFTEWGNRWYDLKRTATAGTVLKAEKMGWKDTDTLYPVPNSQRQLDNLLTQNPGYN